MSRITNLFSSLEAIFQVFNIKNLTNQHVPPYLLLISYDTIRYANIRLRGHEKFK